MDKLTICVDFDGVLNTYTGWQGENELYEPKEGVKEFLSRLNEDFKVIIHTARDPKKVIDWIEKHGLINYIYDVTNKKVPAMVYIDDRAIKFKGDYDLTLFELSQFKTHWERKNTFTD